MNSDSHNTSTLPEINSPNTQQFVCPSGSFFTIDPQKLILSYTDLSKGRDTLVGDVDQNNKAITINRKGMIPGYTAEYMDLNFINTCKNSEEKSLTELYNIK